ncbi:MAG: hypothetical protein Q3M30_03150 [Candidatus Electrothrix sp. Rat3]|nr:hypothetical protein [Candidatus Electrothrix rattekaaiensis]
MRKPRDWKQPCPNPECDYYTLMNRGNVSAISTYLTQSGRRRIFSCKGCKTFFSETRDTVFYDLGTPEEKVIMVLKMFLVRVDLAGVCFVFGITEENALRWLKRTAKQADAINVQLMRELFLYNYVAPIFLEIRNSLAKQHQPIYFNSVYITDISSVAPGPRKRNSFKKHLLTGKQQANSFNEASRNRRDQ